MSFSQEQKAETLLQPIKTSCCKRAMLQGILAAKAEMDERTICISVDGSELITYIKELIFEIYSQEAEIFSPKSGGRRKLLCFKSKSAEKYITNFEQGVESYSEKCAICLSAFLRGVFLVSGRVSDPVKQYSLEFNFGDRAERFSEIFNELGFEPKLSVKSTETLVYFRNSNMIEDFFAMANMNNTAFKIMNAKIEGELRNNANRISNCEMNNIDRAVSASVKQFSLLEKLMELDMLSLLPDELEATARFRLEHEDWSLSRMAGEITPPISKSGLAHRLKKITEMAEAILSGKYVEP